MSNTHPLKEQIALLIGITLETVAPDAPVSLEIERPKTPDHGDFSSNAAMQLARPLKKNPRELAQLILTELPNERTADGVPKEGAGTLALTADMILPTMSGVGVGQAVASRQWV